MSIFRGRQVLFLSSIDWDSSWQRHQALAAGMAAAGAEVFFVENTGFRWVSGRDAGRILRRLRRIASPPAPSSGPRVVSPVLLPPSEGLPRKINTSLLVPLLVEQLVRLGLRASPVVFAYLPTRTTLALLDSLGPGLTVYDCVANFRAHPQASSDILELERELLARSDLVVTDSTFLHEQKSSEHPYVLKLHHGVSPAFFGGPRPAPPTTRKLCYFGTLWSAIDYRPIRALGEAGFEVTLIGPAKEPLPGLPAGVRRTGPIPHSELPKVLSEFDALLLPYVTTDFTKGVIPAKLYECLATGLPVIGSALPSLRSLERLVHVAEGPEDFVRIARSLPTIESEARSAERIENARGWSTDGQLRKLKEAIEAALERRGRSAPTRAAQAAPRPGIVFSFLQGFSWIAVFFLMARALMFATQVLAARFLGPIEFGQANLVLAAASVLQVLPMLGFPLSLARNISAEDSAEGRRRMVSTVLLCFILWSAGSLALLRTPPGPINRHLQLDASSWTLALAYAYLTAAYLTGTAALQGLACFRERGAAEALYGIVSFLALGALIYSGHHSFRALVFASMAGLSLAGVYAFSRLMPFAAPGWDRRTAADLALFTVLGTFNIIATAFIQTPGRIVVFHCATAREAGIYSAYFAATAQVALALIFMAQTVLIPLTSRSEAQADAWSALDHLPSVSFLGLFAGFVACGALIMSLMGRSYPLHWEWIVLFATSATLMLVHGVLSALFASQSVRGLVISVVGTLAAGAGNLVLTLAWAPRWGVTGAGTALAFGYGLGLAWYACLRPARPKSKMLASARPPCAVPRP